MLKNRGERMKYQVTKNVPKEKRKEYNEKLIYLIKNNKIDNIMSKNDIYSIFTEKGGNHDLMFKDYKSYYDYSYDKKIIEEGQFFTPDSIIEEIYSILKPCHSDLIADLTAGKGSFINFCPNEKNFYANEIDNNCCTIMKYIFENANITNNSIEYYNPHVKFNIIVGNPPFNLYINDIKSQHYYFLKSNELLINGGFLAVLVPDSYLKDMYYNKSAIEQIDEYYNFIGQYSLKKDAFENANIKTKVMFFIKKCESIDYDKKYCNEYNSIDEISEKISELKTIIESNRYKIFFENRKHNDNNYSFSNTKNNTDNGFNFKLRKYLFEIKQHHFDKINLAYSYIDKFKKQERPSDITAEQWAKMIITENKVLAYLKKLMKNKSTKITKYQNLSDYKSRKKDKLFQIENTPFSKVENYNNLDNLVYNTIDEKYIELNNVQKEITNKLLYKRYGMLQAEQGSGKTLMGIHLGLVRLKTVNNVFIVGPAIAIKGTWQQCMEDYNISYKMINSLSELKNIKTGDFVLLTFSMLSKYSRFIKKYLKSIKYNIQSIVDESDNICNLSSKRSKVTISTLYKSKYKLLLSGTLSRNDISELYPQYNFLYGSSNNFLNKCKYVYENENNEIVEVVNEHKNVPFPSYKKGYTMFRSCFNPEITTVFGIGKNTQNIYNSIELKELLDKSIITKSFKDIVGKKIYEIKQHLVTFNNAEKELYYKAIHEFYQMKYLFKSTGEPRKDRMLEIIQQLNLMLDICSQANLYDEYNSSDITNKQKHVLELLNKFDEKVAIGCRTLKELKLYHNIITEYLPNRKVIVIDGSIDIKKRKKIIDSIENDKNTILLSTQQSLSSSLNIGFINKVIITRLPYNLASLSQYYFRFIRFNSTSEKEIHFVTYGNSLESNLLKLICTKENLIKFTKYDDVDAESDLGVDFDLINMLLSKEKDKDGKTFINWGEQKIG